MSEHPIWGARSREPGRALLRGADGAPAHAIVAARERSLRAALGMALGLDGATVGYSDNGAALYRDLLALDIARQPLPDLLVLEAALGGWSGVELIRGLRAIGWDVPALCVVRNVAPGLAQRARDVGAAAVFEWPFDLEDFRTVALHIVRRHTRTRAQSGIERLDGRAVARSRAQGA